MKRLLLLLAFATFWPNWLLAQPFSAQIQRALAAYPQRLAADPTCDALAQRLYYNTVSNVVKFCNGSSWLTLADTASAGAPPFDDATAIIKGSGDPTKLLRIEVDGFTGATTRVLTPPNFDGTIATLAGTENFTNKTFTNTLTMSGTSLIAIGASTIGAIGQATTLTPDGPNLYTGTTSNTWHLREFGDAGTDQNNCHAGTGASAYPAFCGHSAVANTTDWWSLGHNGTDTVLDTNNGGLDLSGITGTYKLDRTVTAAGTTGAQTINKTAGTVNFAASASTLVVTNSLVTASSIIFVDRRTNDSVCFLASVEAGSGSFTIRMTAACNAETSVGFLVTN